MRLVYWRYVKADGTLTMNEPLSCRSEQRLGTYFFRRTDDRKQLRRSVQASRRSCTAAQPEKSEAHINEDEVGRSDKDVSQQP
jgi:hypothetical protein